MNVEMLNNALHEISADNARYHLCWGGWHGPHSSDIELKDIIDLVLKVDASAYSFEAANPRHEHEWRLWRDVDPPEGKILLPGVLTH